MNNQKASPECTQPIRGSESQTSYPRVQWENTSDKRGATEPQRKARKEGTQVNKRES